MSIRLLFLAILLSASAAAAPAQRQLDVRHDANQDTNHGISQSVAKSVSPAQPARGTLFSISASNSVASQNQDSQNQDTPSKEPKATSKIVGAASTLRKCLPDNWLEHGFLDTPSKPSPGCRVVAHRQSATSTAFREVCAQGVLVSGEFTLSPNRGFTGSTRIIMPATRQPIIVDTHYVATPIGTCVPPSQP